MTTRKRVGFAVLSLVVGCAIWCAARRPPPKDLSVYGSLPAFELTERSGEAFRSEALRGKVWVASFLFTTCRGQCPILAARLRELQKAMRGETDFRLVSFTVDPERDTPETLRAYADREGADRSRWLFLTGKRDDLSFLLANGFRVSGGLAHSAHFVLVDKEGRLRGFYDANDRAAMTELSEDARRLTGG